MTRDSYKHFEMSSLVGKWAIRGSGFHNFCVLMSYYAKFSQVLLKNDARAVFLVPVMLLPGEVFTSNINSLLH